MVARRVTARVLCFSKSVLRGFFDGSHPVFYAVSRTVSLVDLRDF